MWFSNVSDEKETVMNGKLSLSKEWHTVAGKIKKNAAPRVQLQMEMFLKKEGMVPHCPTLVKTTPRTFGSVLKVTL